MKSFANTKNILSAMSFILISALNAYAAPSISSVSGTFTHGQTVTVYGSGFGTKSPVAPALWDNLSAYSGYTNGQIIPFPSGCDQDQNCTGSNPVGWDSGNGYRVGYKTTNPRGKWTAAYSNSWSGSSVNGAALGGMPITGANTSKVVYLTWYQYNAANPAPNGDASNKFLRLDSQSSYGPGLFELVIEPSHCLTYPYGGSETDYWDGWSGSWPAWNRIEVNASSNGSTYSFSWWNNNSLQGNHSTSSSQFTYIINDLGADAANAPMGTMDWNSIYADNTRARVEVCNANTKSGSNHCEIQIPKTTWVDGQLQITVNQGSFADGSTAYLYVIDASGNASSTNSASTITFGGSGGSDTTNPTVSMSAPTSGTIVSGNVTVTATATDNVGVASVQFYVDSTSNTPVATDTASPYTFTWNSATVANGSHTLYAKATDTSGNTSTASVSITVNNTSSDTTSPTAAITAPASGATVSGNVTVTASASDNIAVSKVEFFVDSTSSTAISTVTSSPYTFTWNSATATNGSHTLFAKATDSSNNSTVSSGIQVNVSNSVTAGTYTVTFGNTPDATYTNTIQDSFIDISTTLYSSSTILSAYTWPVNQPANAILMKFDLSSLPAGAVVQSATLYLYLNYLEYGGGDSTYLIGASKIINKNPVVATATGYTYNGSSSWDASSVAYNSIPLAQANKAAPVDSKQIDKTYGYKSWNIAGIVQEWLDNPATNYGILLNGSTSASADSNRGFASSRATDSSQRPKLVVTYTLGGPSTPTISAFSISPN
jgi:hypothetical protein